MSHFYYLREKKSSLTNKFFCPINAFTLFHIALNILYNLYKVKKLYKTFNTIIGILSTCIQNTGYSV